MDRCLDPSVSRRRLFWTTQPNACGVYQNCGSDCGFAGLQFVYADDLCGDCRCSCPGPVHDPDCLAAYRATRGERGLTFATNDWIRSLLLNIFNTKARDDATSCGVRPGSQGGHWSESYLEGANAAYIGTGIFKQKAKGRMRDAINMLRAQAAKDAYKLVSPYGVATSVDVQIEHTAGTQVQIAIDVRGPGITEGVVNLSAKLLDNSWVWS